MRILHVIGSISRQGGGPSRSSQGLVAGLRAAGVDAWLMTLNHGEEPWIKGCEKFINGGSFEEALEKAKPDIVHLHGIWLRGIHRCAVTCRKRGIPYVIAPRGMLEPWSLKQKWLKKRVARFLYQDRDLKKAAALHATAESEAEQFRKLGFKNYVIVSPNGVNLPEGKCLNGGIGECLNGEAGKCLNVGMGECLNGQGKNAGRESRSTEDGFSNSNIQTFPNSNIPHRALFVSRMHPKKGVLELVESWARVFRNEKREVSNEKWQCELVYTLNGEEEREYESKVKRRIVELGMTYEEKKCLNVGICECLNGEGKKVGRESRSTEDGFSNSNIQTFSHSNISSPDFIFTGPLDDEAKWGAYARADLFVLPTYSENFGIVVAEALWAGVPVITTKGTPWRDLLGVVGRVERGERVEETGRCGWWIDLPGEKECLNVGMGECLNEEGKKVGRESRSTADGSSNSNIQTFKHSNISQTSLWPALDAALREACGAEGLRALPAMGANGHRLVEEKYTWKAVVGAMVHGYEQVLNTCEFAPCDSCRNYGDTCQMR